MVNLNFNIYIPAVIVAAVVSFALGGLWYSPLLFAKQWVAAHEFSPEKMASMGKEAGKAYVTTFFCWLVMAAVMSILVDRAGVFTLIGGVKLGILCWIGFCVPIGLSGHVFSGRKVAVFVIDAGYQLVSLIVIGMILGAWQV